MYNPYPNSPYSTLGNSRNQFMQPQQQSQQQQYDFSGWGDRLTSIEQGIKGLTEHFKNINVPGAEVGEGAPAPEYAGNTAPAPLAAAPVAPLDAAPVDTGFNFDPSGGSLMSQLSSAYGGQTHEEWGGGRGQPGFTQGFADFFTGEGYYADPRGTYLDGGWNISDKPIDLGSRFGGTLDPYGNMGSAYGNNDIANMSSPHGGSSWEPRGAGGEPLSSYHMFQGPEGEQRLAGLFGIGIGPTTRQPVDPNAPQIQYEQNQNAHQPFQTFASPSGGKMAGGVGAGINGLASLLSQKGSTI